MPRRGPGAPPGERRSRACSTSTASTTLTSSACPGQLPVSALDLAVADLAVADLGPGIPHPDLALLAHHTNALASERGQSRSSGGEAVAVMATIAKGYDLDYAWRAVGEAY